MSRLLLWAECLACSLLFAALMTACIARIRRPRARAVLLVLAMSLPFALYAGAMGLTVGLLGEAALSASWFGPLLAAILCYVAAAAWMMRRGLRRSPELPDATGAPAWPRGKLAWAFAAAAVVGVITFWNADLTIRQRLNLMRAEAGAMALAVAPPRPADRDNAAIVYERAFERLGPENAPPAGWKSEWDGWLDANADDFDANDPDLREFLSRQEPTLRLLRLAARKPGCYFEHPYHDPDVSMLFPELWKFSQCSMLLALSARRKTALRDVRGAAEEVQTMFALAEHAGSSPLLISVLVGIKADQRAAKALQRLIEAAKPSAEELAALHVEESFSYRRMFERSLRMEEAFRLSCFATFDGSEDPDAMGWAGVGLVPPFGALYRIFVMPQDLAAHHRLSQKYRELAGLPYYEAREGWENIEKEMPIGPLAFLTNLLMPALSTASGRMAEGDARRRVVRVGIAALRYRARSGRLPARLEDLVPDFLPVVPLDPYDGKPLRWKPVAGGAAAYSVGPDGADDGGAPLDRRRKAGDVAFRVPG